MPVVLLVARLSLVEAARGRTVRAMLALAGLLLAVFALACAEGMDAARDAPGTRTEDLVGSTLLGTAAFTALLLGTIIAVNLAAGTIRGDADRGLLQPLLVRPVPRTAILAGRLSAAALVAGGWTAAVWLAAVLLMRVAGAWSSPAVLGPALALAAAAALVAVAAATASAWLGQSAAAMTTLGLVGVGFTFGLLAQLGGVLGVESLRQAADVLSAVLPFEALYRDVLFRVNGSLGDLSGLGFATGPFGGARAMTALSIGWTALWAVLLSTLTIVRFRRIDL